MATMSATMKQFTKGLKTTFEPMQTSLANIEQSLVIQAQEKSREEEVEAKRLEKKKLDEETKQTSWLKKLFGKKDEKGEGGGFITRHWKKIVAGLLFILTLLPKSFFRNLISPKWWKDHAWMIGGAIAGALLLKLGLPMVWNGVAAALGGALMMWWRTRGLGGSGMDGGMPFRTGPGKGGGSSTGLPGLGTNPMETTKGSKATKTTGKTQQAFKKALDVFKKAMGRAKASGSPRGIVIGGLAALGAAAYVLVKDLSDEDKARLPDELQDSIVQMKDTTKSLKAEKRSLKEQLGDGTQWNAAAIQQHIQLVQKQIDKKEQQIKNMENAAKRIELGPAIPYDFEAGELQNEQELRERLTRSSYSGNPYTKIWSGGLGSVKKAKWFMGDDPLNFDPPSPESMPPWFMSFLTKLRDMFSSRPRGDVEWKAGLLSADKNLTKNTLAKLEILADYLGGIRITSGRRTDKQQKNAMLNAVDLDGPLPANRKKQLKEAGLLGTEVGTIARMRAVEKLIEKGYKSFHQTGQAFDFSYPKNITTVQEKKAFKAKIKTLFPKARLAMEPDHVHMRFDPNIKPEDIARDLRNLQNQNLALRDDRITTGGGNNVVSVTNNNNNQSGRTTTFVPFHGTVDNSNSVYHGAGPLGSI